MMTSRFLETKFHFPARRAVNIPRPRLLEFLQTGLNEGRKLSLVSAPAGYGKTTLIADWLHSQSTDRHIAWLSLDERDNDLTRFLGYWMAMFGRIDEMLGQHSRSMLGIMPIPSVAVILEGLINELAGTETPMVVVLDDYHLITNPAVHETLEYFIDHQPSQLHLVITTREDPPLSLARMRSELDKS